MSSRYALWMTPKESYLISNSVAVLTLKFTEATIKTKITPKTIFRKGFPSCFLLSKKFSRSFFFKMRNCDIFYGFLFIVIFVLFHTLFLEYYAIQNGAKSRIGKNHFHETISKRKSKKISKLFMKEPVPINIKEEQDLALNHLYFEKLNSVKFQKIIFGQENSQIYWTGFEVLSISDFEF